MTPKEADEKKGTQAKSGEHEKDASKQSASEQDRAEEKKKLPEPPGNLRRRAEWFQKRH